MDIKTYDQAKALCLKIRTMIDTSNDTHKECVNKYICLANRSLREYCDNSKDDLWGVIGMSEALRRHYDSKFGKFVPMM